MKSLAHLSDAALRHELIAAVARDRITTAELLAHIAEFDARKLYVPEGYSSMHAYCVEELHLSEDAAYKRIQAARAGREFPLLFEALAEGRLHLAAVCLLAPHLTHENVEQLVTAATHRRKADVEDLIARRAAPLRASRGTPQLAPGQVGDPGSDPSPLPERRFPLHLTIPESTHAKVAYARALLSHAIPSGDMVELLDRALDALIEKLEKRKIGAGSRVARPAGKGAAAGRRYIPAHVRRAVWERDGGRCTFVSKSGHRCGERRFLEFDHVEPVTRGGTATVTGIRLRCRAHNQYEAERMLGAGFMMRKRGEARVRAGKLRLRTAAREQTEDVVAGLRALGCRADQARRAAELSATEAGGTLEERMRAALRFLGRRSLGAALAAPSAQPTTTAPNAP